MSEEQWQEHLRFDSDHLWHPYTSMTAPTPVWPVVSAEGVRLKLADGRQLIDGMASWWSVIHGYNHPVLNDAMHDQIERMAHVMFGGLTHEPAIELGRQLVSLTPPVLGEGFSLRFRFGRCRAGKHRLLALGGGYHGDTFGAMSVCDPVNGMHHIFSGSLPAQLFAPAPTCRFQDEWEPGDVEVIERLIEDHSEELAAVILDPIVQGAGGMRFYHPQYLSRVRELCDQFDVLLIADEIATGFGRTGRLFACEHADVVPDVLCLGKALTGGTLTLAATLTTAEVAETISRGGAGCFMHGPTFMGNPLACRVAATSIGLLLTSGWKAKVERIERELRLGLAPAADMEAVADVRVLGAIGVVEMHEPVDMDEIMSRFVDAGFWVRPFGKLVYVMPPYVIGKEDLAALTAAVVQVVSARNFR